VDVAGVDEPHALSEQTFEDAGRFSPEGGTLLTLAAGQIKLIDLEDNVQQTIQEPGAYCSAPRGPPMGNGSPTHPRAEASLPNHHQPPRWPGTAVTQTSANEIDVEWATRPDRYRTGDSLVWRT